MLMFRLAMIVRCSRLYLEETKVARAVQMLEDGLSQRNVAISFGVHRRTVPRLMDEFSRDWKVW